MKYFLFLTIIVFAFLFIGFYEKNLMRVSGWIKTIQRQLKAFSILTVVGAHGGNAWSWWHSVYSWYWCSIIFNMFWIWVGNIL